jgi:arylsulfatase A-like enzyme
MWISDPDTTAHTRGIGAPATREALTLADAEIGRIEDTLQAKGLLSRTNLIVTADHGFSTHTGTFKLDALVDPFGQKMPDGSRDIVVSEGAIYLRASRDPARVAAIVAALQRRPEVGAVFTKPPARGGVEGVVPGTLSFDVVRWNHARSGDILASANWSREKNEAGYEGQTGQSGTAGHGATSPFDIHIPLIAAGPDFRERAVSDAPTGNADIAPTLLRVLGSVRVEHTTETVKTRDGSYELTAHISTAAGHRYLDFTEVKR